ncbi:hypothetical protein [Streptomyces sp. NPDC051642]|uniref:hypothetical protein n=1 Tax=unclassified Streptomyces TaxID=2593676 RepID=UPI003419108B
MARARCAAFLNGTAGPRFQRVRKVADLQPGDTVTVDCTSDPHGVYALTNYPKYPDTRMVGNVPGENLQGVGIGHMMFYAADTTGEFSRYRWSVNS